MRKFERCYICREWHWVGEPCLPEYLVYHEEYSGDEPYEIRACSHEDAAEKYGKRYNEDGDYSLMNDEIEVRVEKDGEIRWFTVGAEPDIYYSVNEIESRITFHFLMFFPCQDNNILLVIRTHIFVSLALFRNNVMEIQA